MGSNLTESSTYSANVVGPDAGNLVTAASVRVMGTALACRTKALQDGKISVASGVTLTCLSGSTLLLDAGSGLVSNGSAEFNGTGADKTTIAEADVVDLTVTGKATFSGTGADVTVIAEADAATVSVDDLTIATTCDVESPAVMTVKSGAQLVTSAGSTLSMQGRKRRRSRVQLSVADHSVGPADGDCFELAPNNSGVQRKITLLSVTGQTAQDGEIVEFIVPDLTNCAAGSTWLFQREDLTAIATFTLDFTISPPQPITAQFEFVGTVWRLGLCSGWDDSNGVGVVSHVGA